MISPEIWNNSHFNDSNTSFNSDILNNTAKYVDNFVGIGRKVDMIIAEIQNLPACELDWVPKYSSNNKEHDDKQSWKQKNF